MEAALAAAFTVFVTLDRNLGFQQNLAAYPIGVIFLRVLRRLRRSSRP